MNAYVKDLVERVVSTALFAFVSAISFQDLDGTWRLGAVAAGAAALSLIKGALAKYIGDETAGLKK